MNNLFVISAPSGAGKTSLIKALLEDFSDISLSISHTTRVKRPTEIDTQNYFFTNIEDFEKLINNNELLEYAKVFENYYGTSKKNVISQLEKTDVILEIDWQGYQQIKKQFPQIISIFILPPSLQELEARLINRAEDKKEVIDKRMLKAKNEIKHYQQYDYLIVNENFNIALNELKSIITTYHLNIKSQQKKLQKLLTSF